MSKMGRAVEWIQENGLEDHPDALVLYIQYMASKKSDTENAESEKNNIDDSE